MIGTGIAGNAAAWPCQNTIRHVYDAIPARRHSHTVIMDYDGTRLASMSAIIVYNELNYPDSLGVFAHLGVETVDSLHECVTADTGRFEWKGGGHNWFETANGLFAQRRNLLSPSYLWCCGTS